MPVAATVMLINSHAHATHFKSFKRESFLMSVRRPLLPKRRRIIECFSADVKLALCNRLNGKSISRTLADPA
jgi:hypothetical protein